MTTSRHPALQRKWKINNCFPSWYQFDYRREINLSAK